MSGYINELLGIVIVCRIVTMIAPDGETNRRYLGALCALVTMSALVSPIVHIVKNFGEISETAAGIFLADTDEKEGKREDLGSLAAVIFTFAEEEFGISTKGGEAVFYTDENGKEHQSALNFVNEEGTWEKWDKNLKVLVKNN